MLTASMFRDKKKQKMTLSAIYAAQHLDTRAYGNYVGLRDLGIFMAAQMGLELKEVNCAASALGLNKMNKGTAKELVDKYRSRV